MQEPATLPDFTDSPEDEMREIAANEGIPSTLLAKVLAAIRRAGSIGILERMGFAEGEARPSQEMIRRVLAVIGDGRNAGLRVWCLDFLAGTNVFGGKSETDIGRRWGFTRANVCLIVQELRDKLNIHSAPGCKQESCKAVYSERAKRNHSEGRIKRNKPQSFSGRHAYTNLVGQTQ